MAEIKLDDIVADLTPEQMYKLAEFQAKVRQIQELPSFDQSVLQDTKYHSYPNGLFTAVTTNGSDVHATPNGEVHTELDVNGGTKHQTTADPAPLQWDVSLIKTKNFHKVIGDLSPQTLREGMWKNVKHDDPDTLVVRHLEARNWDVDAALLMMFNSVRWRTELDIPDGLIGGGELQIKETAENGSDPEKRQIATEVMAQFRSGKSFSNGVDREGRPLLFTRVKKHNPSFQGLKGLETYTVYQSESARMLMRPPVTTATIVFDLGGFSMANMDWNAIRLLTAGLEDKYPESMGATYVYRAPWIVNGIWSIVKPMMPGKEAQKVTFVRDAKQLSQYIDLKYLPADMGGTGDFEFEFKEPVPGENDLMKDTAKRDEILQERQKLIDEYEKATIDWLELVQLEASREGLYSVKHLDSTLVESAMRNAKSTSAEQAMRKKREVMAKLRENYFVLDPYVRGRCNGDRLGMKPIDEYDLGES